MSPLGKNAKSKKQKDLQQDDTGAYKPAYKQNPKTGQKEIESLPPDLAQIISVWGDLPEHIKAAIKTLAEINNDLESE